MTQKIVYSFNPETREYLGLETADMDPLEPDSWLIPANATEVEPPAIPPGHVAKFATDYWVLEQVHVIEPAANDNPVPPPQVPTPTRAPWQAREQALARLAAHRLVVETGGTVVGGQTIKTDVESQSKIGNTLLAMQAGFVTEVDWKTSDGWVTLTLAELQGVAAAVAVHVQQCYARERALADHVAALPDDLAVIDAFDAAAMWVAG